MKFDPDWILLTIPVCVIVAIGVIVISSTSVGFDEGVKKGKNEGIVYCMEKPKECKTTYNYLKLQENQK